MICVVIGYILIVIGCIGCFIANVILVMSLKD